MKLCLKREKEKSFDRNSSALQENTNQRAVELKYLRGINIESFII